MHPYVYLKTRVTILEISQVIRLKVSRTPAKLANFLSQIFYSDRKSRKQVLKRDLNNFGSVFSIQNSVYAPEVNKE